MSDNLIAQMVFGTLCLALLAIVVSICVYVLAGGAATPKGDCGKKGVKATYPVVSPDVSGGTGVVVICKSGKVYHVSG